MRHTRVATEQVRWPYPLEKCGALISAVLFFSIAGDAQKIETVVDLTTPPPVNQQGLTVLGGRVGGPSRSLVPQKYDLPLRLQIVRASADSSNDFILHIRIQNVGKTALELPISRNLSDIQRKPGRFRRELYFGVIAVPPLGGPSHVIAATAGSYAIAHSFLRLEPQQSYQVIFRVESAWVKSSLPAGKGEVQLHVFCGEWAMKDDQYVIESTAQEVVSENTSVLGFNGGTPLAAVSGP